MQTQNGSVCHFRTTNWHAHCCEWLKVWSIQKDANMAKCRNHDARHAENWKGRINLYLEDYCLVLKRLDYSRKGYESQALFFQNSQLGWSEKVTATVTLGINLYYVSILGLATVPP